MSIIVPRKEPSSPSLILFWRIHYLDGETFSCEQGTWNDQAHLERVGGIQVGVSQRLIHQVEILYRDIALMVVPPQPTHVFAFARYCASLSDGNAHPQWLYTVFGYEYEGQRSLLFFTLEPNQVRMTSQFVHEPFPLSLLS